MRKLLIVAAAVFCGTIVHAASINWQITGATSAQVGYSVYMVSAISEAWTSGADVAADAAKLGAGTSGTIAKSGRVYNIPETTASGAGITSSASLYLVLVQSADAKSAQHLQRYSRERLARSAPAPSRSRRAAFSCSSALRALRSAAVAPNYLDA